MIMLWITADLHYGHVNMAEWRGMKDVEEMNQAIKDDWFTKVKSNDVVMILGDAIMGLRADGLKEIKQWPGLKILMCGNHDHPWSGMSQKYRDKWTDRYKEVFVLSPETIEAGGILYCHFPYSGDHVEGEPRFLEFRPKDEGCILAHGHVHDKWATLGREINVGWDVRDGLWDLFGFRQEIAEVRKSIIKDTMNPRYDIEVELIGHDGNAIAIIGTVRRELRRAGASAEEIGEYSKEAMSGNYNHLITVTAEWINII